MKILIAISSKEHSESTLNMGMQVAKAFNASTTIVDVGKKINDFRNIFQFDKITLKFFIVSF